MVGCALTVERLMLPPSAEASVPEDLDGARLTKWVASHPDRQEVRMTVAVLRDAVHLAAEPHARVGTRREALGREPRELVLLGLDAIRVRGRAGEDELQGHGCRLMLRRTCA